MQTLQVLPLANLQAEKSCDQAIYYHNSGSQIVKSLGTDFVTLQNVEDLNVSLLTESEKFQFDKSVIASLNESGAVKKLEIEINFTHNNYQLNMQNHSQKRLNHELNTKLY